MQHSLSEPVPDVLARGALELRVCVRTYRLFYVPDTEDFLLHVLSEDEKATMAERRAKLGERQRTWAKEVESGKWSERRMATNTVQGVDPASEGNQGPSTGVGMSSEARPNGDGGTSIEAAAADHGVEASDIIVPTS